MKTYKDIDMYKQSFICVKDLNDFKIWGNYNSGASRAFMVVFEKCNSENVETAQTTKIICKNDTEINKWLEGRYFLTLEN